MYGPALVFDPIRSEVVLCGSASSSAPSQTWIWDGTTWTKKSTPTTPWGRPNTRAVWHPERKSVVLYGGGQAGSTSSTLGDLWEWNGQRWTQLANIAPPGVRSDHQIVYDDARECLVVHGGRRHNDWLTDTWEWNKTGWVQRNTAANPGKTINFAMSFDQNRRRSVLFGGAAIATWTYGPDFPATARSYGNGCRGSAGNPTITPEPGGLPWLGGEYRHRLSNAPAATPVILGIGLSDSWWAGVPLPFDLSPIGMTGCSLLVSPDVTITQQTDASGIARLRVFVPNQPSMLGAEVFTQAFVADALANRFAATTSNAVALQIGGR